MISGIRNFPLLIRPKSIPVALSFGIKLRRKLFLLEQDWNPLSFSESGVLEVDDLIFAGYGLRPKQLVNEDEYDSYTHLEVKDKCVMVLGGLPDSWSEEEKENLRYDGTYQKKARIARDLGAKGIIFINPESDDPYPFQNHSPTR